MAKRINQSKINDPRYWERWRNSGAVGTMPDKYSLPCIEQALQEGHRMHGFLSGGGLRVVRVELSDVLKGYGEHFSVDEALVHANEDLRAGGRPYEEVYGKLYPHFLTGTHDVSSPLDGWLLQGRTFDAYRINGDIVVELHGYAETKTPKDVSKKVNKTGGPVNWKSRGYTYETVMSRFPNGEPCESTGIVDGPDKDGADPWMYKITKTGRGERFSLALEQAFKAQEVEVSIE